MFRRECIGKVGLYRAEFAFSQDYDLWLRIGEAYKLANIPEPLYQWRFGAQSKSVRYSDLQRRYSALAVQLAGERKTRGMDSLQPGRPGLPEESPSKRTIAGNLCYWGALLSSHRAYGEALKVLATACRLDPLYFRPLPLMFKTLVKMVLPASLVSAIEREEEAN